MVLVGINDEAARLKSEQAARQAELDDLFRRQNQEAHWERARIDQLVAQFRQWLLDNRGRIPFDESALEHTQHWLTQRLSSKVIARVWHLQLFESGTNDNGEWYSVPDWRITITEYGEVHYGGFENTASGIRQKRPSSAEIRQAIVQKVAETGIPWPYDT